MRVDEAPHESGSAASTVPGAPHAEYAWADAPRKRRRLGLWIGAPLAVVMVGVIASSLVLIAPGTAVAGVSVGGMTAGAAAAAIQSQLDDTTISLKADGVDATVTGKQLGATVDASALAGAAFDEHPMWNVTAWFSGNRHAPVSVDKAKATKTLMAAAPELYVAPKDATVQFDSDSKKYTTTAAASGSGLDLASLTTALQNGFTAGKTTISVTAKATTIEPAISTKTAKATASSLNKMLAKAGFYVGKDRVVPVSPTVAASWLTVTADGDSFTVTADKAAIQKVVDTLPKAVNRDPQNGSAITDPDGKILRTVTPTLDGRTLGDTSTVAADYAAKLADGDGVYTLPVDVTKATTATTSRNIVVDLSDQTTYLYENGKLLHSYLISSGDAAHATPTGTFRTFAHVSMQDMGCYEGAEYCTKNVPWVTYFAPNIGFHGTYWHHNFGHVMSHGCVNMPIDVAKFVYDWTPVGTPVTVRQ